MKFYGSVFYWNEQGMEGGMIAFQDQKFNHYEEDMVDGKCPYGDTASCPVFMMKEWGPIEGRIRRPMHSSYDGTHVLNKGDILTVWEDDSRENLLLEKKITKKFLRETLGTIFPYPEWLRQRNFARLEVV